MTQFKKSDLDLKSIPNLNLEGDGFRVVLDDLELSLRDNQGKALSVDVYLKADHADGFGKTLFADAKLGKVAKNFIKHLAAHDLDPKNISAFDLAYAIYELYGEQWKESWQPIFADGESAIGDAFFGVSKPHFSYLDRYRAIGAPLLDPKADAALRGKSLLLLQSLSTYVNGLPASEPLADSAQALDFYYTLKDPAVFPNYLQLSYQDFLAKDAAGQAQIFAKAAKRQFPDAAIAGELFKYLNHAEAVAFTKECFQVNVEASLPLFEKVRSTSLLSSDDWNERKSEEAMYFPNLPQTTPYANRQAAIDKFLGTPVMVRKTNIWKAAQVGAHTTIKKYLWVGQTEVFSIESEKPGPTTLIFSPHFHEKNPRKQFHWLKDIPLKSGRIIVIPEANRAMDLLKLETNPMNSLFDEALTHDRMDYLVVRRVEYLMGLVDGFIGVHDAYNGPYFISDMVKKNKFGNNINPDPIPSPWMPSAVTGIVDISETMAGGAKLRPQPQWQVADTARGLLNRFTGNDYKFVAEDLDGPQSDPADSATGYMNFHLKKPGMTFEGRKGKEHGQLHAMAIYGMLLAYGHKIDASYEKLLLKPYPKIDHSLYIGLPIDPPPAVKPASGTTGNPANPVTSPTVPTNPSSTQPGATTPVSPAQAKPPVAKENPYENQ